MQKYCDNMIVTDDFMRNKSKKYPFYILESFISRFNLFPTPICFYP